MNRSVFIIVLCGLGLPTLGLLACGEEVKSTSQVDSSVESSVATDTQVDEEIPLPSFEVTGVVVDADEQPVVDAMVFVGGREDTMVMSGADGSFSLWYTALDPKEGHGGYGDHHHSDKVGEPAIVAAKIGYRSAGFEFFKPDTPITLRMRQIAGPDNVEYVYEDPGDGIEFMEENCSHCHTSFVAEFLQSKHAEATSNPLLQDLYAGITRLYSSQQSCEDAGGKWATGLEPGIPENGIEKCYLGGGVLSDLNEQCGGASQPACDDPSLGEASKPQQFGACADCHAPGINGIAGDRNLHDAVGISYEIGVHCDSCHKVSDIDMSKPPGVGKRLVMGRPSEAGFDIYPWSPVFYGPLKDVPNVIMGGSYQPKYDEAVFCAGCHEQKQPALLPNTELDASRWPDGLPVHATYSEWQDGPYNDPSTACQHCHMPANMEMTNSVDLSSWMEQSVLSGFPREPEDNRRHLFRGPLQGEERLIDKAAYVSVKLDIQDEKLEATVSVANTGAGHALPTGEPLRALILLVEAEGSCGPLQAVDGMTIPDTGGVILRGELGNDVEQTGTTLSWPAANGLITAGQVVRVVRPTGIYDDYEGIGFFADPQLEAHEKGLEILAPVGESTIVSIGSDGLVLGQNLELQEGDVLYVGHAWSDGPTDGQAAVSLAGHAGYAFSKVLVDSQGNRHVPHYKAVDMVSDNRIAPASYRLTSHHFALPDGCDSGQVKATLLYRPIPLQIAQLRGWESNDYIMATGSETW